MSDNTGVNNPRLEKWTDLEYSQKSSKELNAELILCENILKDNPVSEPALHAKARLSIRMERYEECIEIYHKLLSINPKDPTSWHNLGVALNATRNYSKAVDAYQNAIDLKPDFLWRSYWNQASTLLRLGDLKRGWKRHEYRLKCCNASPRISTDLKTQAWQGEKIAGKTLLVHHDGGFGDSIQFLRYIPYLQQYGCNVLLFLQPQLNCLFAHLDAPLIHTGSPQPKYDVHVFMLSLPYCFKTDLSNIPPPVKIESTLSPVKGRIGIVWKGGAENPTDSKRSLNLSQLNSILQIPGLHYVCAQKEVSSDDADLLKASGIERPRLKSFKDTVKVLEKCELLISVDTSVAHLAASMGIPTWILIAHNPDWRWLINRTDSPWYPSVRLFRQDRLNSWDEPLQEMARSLQADRRIK